MNQLSLFSEPEPPKLIYDETAMKKPKPKHESTLKEQLQELQNKFNMFCSAVSKHKADRRAELERMIPE